MGVYAGPTQGPVLAPSLFLPTPGLSSPGGKALPWGVAPTVLPPSSSSLCGGGG